MVHNWLCFDNFLNWTAKWWLWLLGTQIRRTGHCAHLFVVQMLQQNVEHFVAALSDIVNVLVSCFQTLQQRSNIVGVGLLLLGHPHISKTCKFMTTMTKSKDGYQCFWRFKPEAWFCLWQSKKHLELCCQLADKGNVCFLWLQLGYTHIMCRASPIPSHLISAFVMVLWEGGTFITHALTALSRSFLHWIEVM